MTQTVQTLPALGVSRKKLTIAAAFKFVSSLSDADKPSPQMRRALLNDNNSHNRQRPSKRPGFLRLYFAMRARHFATSPASRAQRAEQDALKQAAKDTRIAARMALSRQRKSAYVAQQRTAV